MPPDRVFVRKHVAGKRLADDDEMFGRVPIALAERTALHDRDVAGGELLRRHPTPGDPSACACRRQRYALNSNTGIDLIVMPASRRQRIADCYNFNAGQLS